jgi:hypothetical protein
MPKTIQQFISEYSRIKKNIKETEEEEEVLVSQARNLMDKNGLKDYNNRSYSLLSGNHNASQNEITVWNKLNQGARRNFSLKDIEGFSNLDFDDLDFFVNRSGGVDNWWRGLFNGYKTLYNAWGNLQTFGINNHPDGHFRFGERERNTYMLGALYADNYISQNGAPFLNVRNISGDGIGNRANTQYSGSYNILKSGVENAKVIKGISFSPLKIVYLNETQEVENLQERYRKNKKLQNTLNKELETLEKEKNFLQPEKLELIDQYRRISGAIDNLSLKVTELEGNQKAQKNLTDTFFKGAKSGMSMRDELMSQSESLQQDISNLNKNFNAEKNRNQRVISSISTQFKGLNKNFSDLKSLYSVRESKLKEDSNLIKKDVSILQTYNASLYKRVFGIQKEMDENSRNYALEKEKILGEIEGLKEQGEGFRPAINNLNNRLANLTKAHDLTKNSLLEKMKSLEQSNQTRFEEIETKNEDFKNRYNKNTEQLQRDLGFVRAGIDARDRDIEHLANETVQAREAFGRLEKQSNVKFKTLFDYNEYTNRQIKKQERNKLTTLGNIRKAAQPDLVKKAFAGLIRGRFFDAQPILS